MNPQLDHDGDGHTTGEEYMLGTDPTNPDSRLEFRAETFADHLELVFSPLTENRLYQLDQRLTLPTGGWTTLTNLPASTATGEGVFIITIDNDAQSFYRLQIQMAP